MRYERRQVGEIVGETVAEGGVERWGWGEGSGGVGPCASLLSRAVVIRKKRTFKRGSEEPIRTAAVESSTSTGYTLWMFF